MKPTLQPISRAHKKISEKDLLFYQKQQGFDGYQFQDGGI